MNISDPTYETGKIGLTARNATAYFDSFRLRDYVCGDACIGTTGSLETFS